MSVRIGLFKHFWRNHLGCMPMQPCLVCGTWFWGGMPTRYWRASWMDYCSLKCRHADNELMLEVFSSESLELAAPRKQGALIGIGDIVRLNSGGPEMEVVELDDTGELWCQWEVEGTGEGEDHMVFHTAKFHPACVTLIREAISEGSRDE